jgi:hypothetical protein
VAWLAHGKRWHDAGAHHGGVHAAPPPQPGLCASCVHARGVTGARSTFVRCDLADADERFPRYPALPVRRCAGFTSIDPHPDGERPGS